MPTPVAPFPVNPAVISAVAISYKNTKLIADDVLPRIPVGTKEFKYSKMDLAGGFTVPDTKVGRKSRPNRVEANGDLLPATCEDYGLDDIVPVSDVRCAAPGTDPLAIASEFVRGLVALDREIRVAGIAFNPATYPAANKATLSGTSQWSDFANSDPVTAILLALDTIIMRPNVMTIGRAAFTRLAMHPKVCKAVFGNNTDAGVVTREQIARLLELDEVLVGEGFVNTAKRGQSASLQRVWGKHAAFHYRERPQMTSQATTFGFTAEFGDPVAWAKWNSEFGLEGGYEVRSGEMLKEVVCAADLGYFFQNVVA